VSMQIKIDGIDYIVSDQAGFDRLKEDIKSNNNGMGDQHKAKLDAIRGELLESIPEEDKKRIEQENERTGALQALIAGLSNDESAKATYLANKRFPNLKSERGIEPSDLYFIDKDEDLAYIDPNDPTKEYKEYADIGFGLETDDIFGRVFPAGQLVFEMVPETAGFMIGGAYFGAPGAVSLATAGQAAGGGLFYALRAGLSNALDGPPLDTGKLAGDLALNSAFALLPFGLPAESFPKLFRGTVTKFPGVEGRQTLMEIIKEGGEDTERLINLAADRGIVITRPEAKLMASDGAMIQKYLQMQPTSQKLFDFYNSRALQVEETAEDFFNEILSGKFARKQDKLSGKPALDADYDIALASDSVLKKIADKRKLRAEPVYQNAYELDINVDTRDLFDDVVGELADPNIRKGTDYHKALTELRDMLVDQRKMGAVDPDVLKAMKDDPAVDEEAALIDLMGQNLKTDTESLHNMLSRDFRPLIERLTKDNQRFIKAKVSNIRGQVSERLKAANPEYARATSIYDPTKGHLQVLERSVINSLARAVELGGTKAASLTQKLFNGSIKPKEVRDLRRLIQTEDPQVWQNLKGTWLRTQFDDALTTTINPLGSANKFLNRLGLRGNVRKAFPFAGKQVDEAAAKQLDIATAGTPDEIVSAATSEISTIGRAARGRRATVYKEMLDPEELNNFVDLVEIMQATSYIATQSQSPTQTLQSMSRMMENEAKGLGLKVGEAALSLVQLPQRFLLRGFDDVTDKVIGLQRERYEDLLINALIDPSLAADLTKFIQSVNPSIFFTTQSVARGTEATLEELYEGEGEDDLGFRGERSVELREGARENMQREMQELQEEIQTKGEPVPAEMQPPPFNVMNSLTAAPPIAPRPKINPAMSPTILPDPQDRELAMRRQAGSGGILGLV
jgi:hypothetical protein